MSIEIPDSVTSVGSEVFSLCPALTQIVVGAQNANYTSVNGVLFDKNVNNLLECPNGIAGPSYSIPDTVTNIEDFAFWWCTTLTSVTIPDSVVSIGQWAFARTSLAEVTIPNSVVSVGSYAFANSSVTSVTIGNGLAIIASDVFDDCTSLTSVT